MALLVEPCNKAACMRNEKERKLLAGELKFKSQQEYVLQHLGLQPRPNRQTPQKQLQQRAACRTPGGESQLSRQASLPSLSGSQSGSKARGSGSRAASSTASLKASHLRSAASQGRQRPASASRLSTASSAESEAPPPPPQDPVLTVMMKGPPLFSPGLCSRAAYYS
eukprot:CAMPEP_0206437146 /NCGR_PEP_ID=MMETSP0324_2-20121206/10874_1 /ASSEMBLY_ACC=CAM_ASM_000836 /TAXON_ID=2866 /ORGANISM="Crypthecodinium cohnii, Strain Seligo" /LENGTH=166 /DNA_ID=CAMNT_0053904385 /DNA_START=221 /DNA_END=717 /DNA_ORIENTATION=-